MKEWILKNKVVILGLFSAIALAASEIVRGEMSSRVLIFAVILGLISFYAKNFRGQWPTILGLVGNALVMYITQWQTGTVSWTQVILQFMIGLLAAFTPAPKSIGYEHSAIIEEAKKEGQEITPSEAAKSIGQ